jgi:hypothetical protein
MKPTSFFIRFIETPKARVGLRPDAVMETDVFEGQELNVDDVKEIIAAIGTLAEGEMMPQLIVAGPLSGPDVSAMRFLAIKDSSPFAIAEAYVITSLSQKIIARFYLNFNKPARPTKTFGDESEALTWLNEQVQIFNSGEK